MIEYTINSSRLVSAPALLAQGREVYSQSGLVAAYELVYNMFPGIHMAVVDQLLSGERKVYEYPKHISFFVKESEVQS